MPEGVPQRAFGRIAAALELISRSSLTYARPDYGIEPIARPVSLTMTADDGTTKRTAAVFPYDPSGYDGHFVASMNPAAIADWSAFLESYLSTGTPVIP